MLQWPLPKIRNPPRASHSFSAKPLALPAPIPRLSPMLESLLDPRWPFYGVAAVLGLLSLGFVIRFVVPAWKLGRLLHGVTARLAQPQAGEEGQVAPRPDPRVLTREVFQDGKLSHLWREYAQTLHPTEVAAKDGQPGGLRWRATALAETFFTEQALVDTPLRVEFYKHLPGILTGIGILGTFTGLILGLTQFQVGGSAEVVRDSLAVLIQSVGHAFKVSATAIGLAMLFTWIERSLVAARYRQVERLNQVIDGLFDSGVEEEYLARLVRASENTAHQGAQLRQALVGELRQALGQLVAQQREEGKKQQEALAAGLAQAVSTALKEPMTRIAATMEKLSAGQGDTLGQAVGQALDQFAGRLGDQLQRQQQQGDAQLARSLTALEGAGSAFESGIGRLEVLGREAVNALSQQLQGSARQLASHQEAQQSRLTEETERLLARVADQLSGLGDQLGQAAQSLQGGVVQLGQASAGAVDQLRQGATAVREACGEFADGGKEFSLGAQAVMEAGGRIQAAAQSLVEANTGSRQILEEQRQLGLGLVQLVQELGRTVESARKEASLTGELVSTLEAAASQLKQAENQAETYLQGVNQVLIQAHSAFAENVEKTLKEGNTQFQRELAEAVSYLKGAIEHLGDVLETTGEAR